MFGGSLLSLGHKETFTNSGTIGNHAVNNGDLFVFTAFIYSTEFCWVSELPHLSETVTALGQKEMKQCVREKKIIRRQTWNV